MLRRISTIVTCLPLPFISYTLDEIFVEIANIQVSYLLGSKLKSELPIPWKQQQVSVKLRGFSPLRGIGDTKEEQDASHHSHKFPTELHNENPSKRTLISHQAVRYKPSPP